MIDAPPAPKVHFTRVLGHHCTVIRFADDVVIESDGRQVGTAKVLWEALVKAYETLATWPAPAPCEYPIDAAIAIAEAEILDDVRSGLVPDDIESFSDLHDYCDANEYGGLTDPEFWPGMSEDQSAENAVQDAVDLWIRSGALRA